MADSPEPDQGLPPPLPGPEAAARRAQGSPPVESVAQTEQGRPIVKAVLIGIVGFLVSAAIPIVLVIILAFIAQRMIGGH